MFPLCADERGCTMQERYSVGTTSRLLSFVGLEPFSFWRRRFRFSILSEKHKSQNSNVRPPFLLSHLSDSLFLCLSVSLINVDAPWKEQRGGNGQLHDPRSHKRKAFGLLSHQYLDIETEKGLLRLFLFSCKYRNFHSVVYLGFDLHGLSGLDGLF